ncbi:MAG TPA: aminotransferase class I/II-fold pyridoxal phosphate-dependent enzyme [Kofleriaceae bacterium]|nr:aminotransferase class I/II-fold pyridoxal phosphate-dependent enzyme [Kofleriaceae bacterium]
MTKNGSNHASHTGNGIGIDPSTYIIEQFPEIETLLERLHYVTDSQSGNPYFSVHEGVTRDTSVIAGRTMVNFAAYNYLGLSGDGDVNAAVHAAIERYGTSVSASRLVSGEKPLHRELEYQLADFLGCEDAVVMVSGHATNVSVIGHLLGPDDVLVFDSLAHDSILGGGKMAGARRRPFRHNDMSALERVLAAVRPRARRVLIAVEGVYSMDGDIAPLPAIVDLKRRYHALLFVDEAHSFGVLGKTGRGIGERFSVDRTAVDLWMGTLSKALASCGGYIAGQRTLIEYLKYSTPGFVFSVGMSPANAAAALAALTKLRAEPERVSSLAHKSALFARALVARGIDIGPAGESAVVPCLVGSSQKSMQIAAALAARGINVQPIIYPAVPDHKARLRFFVTAAHSDGQLLATADAVAEAMAQVAPECLRASIAGTANGPSIIGAPP